MDGDFGAPIIIKRKKVVAGDGHHGGAWKVAYADFVTAMMAFFMLMWLLNATTEKQRKGLADYFSPNVPISPMSGGGDGAFGGDSLFSEEVLAHNAIGATQQMPSEENAARGHISGDASEDETAEETALFKEVQDALYAYGGESLLSKNALRHVTTRVTDEGLLIEIYALPGAPLFQADGHEPSDLLKTLLQIIAQSFTITSNGAAFEAHTRARPLVLKDNPIWEITTKQAEIVRKLMIEYGFDAGRTKRVTGHADRELRDANPMSVRNDRVELILLRAHD